MKSNNAINEVIFRETANNTSSIVFTPPGSVTNILIVYDTIMPTSFASAPLLIAQTAPNSGVFATTGYQSGVHYSPFNSNAWGNQNIDTGFMLSSAYDPTAGQYHSGYVYITDINTPNNANSFGECADYDPFTALFYYLNLTGKSPTNSTTSIKIQFTNTTIGSGTFTVYTG